MGIVIEKAYKKGTRKVGFDLSEEIACDFEDPYMQSEHLAKLRSFGYDRPLEEVDYLPLKKGQKTSEMIVQDESEDVTLTTDDFFHMYLFVVGLGNPNFIWKELEDVPQVTIGGYGLFNL